MRRFLIALVLAAGFAAPVPAADMVVGRNVSSAAPVALPFPRTARAAAIWDERTCWTQCGSHTAWGMADCLKVDAQGACVERADHADRMCQRACRTSGGPYLSDIFDF